MSQLDAVLARSRAPGTLVERKQFTLARSKAIEKMREFSLRDPHQAVLELVQAAVFAGARWIAVDASADALVVAWVGGRTLSRAELGDLFDYLFADQGIAETRHLMQAAVGVNALLQRRPRRVRIESGDGTVEGTARMDLDRSGAGDVGVPEAPLAGTYLYCELGGGWLGRFTGGAGTGREAELVETRCLYTPTPILLNGQAPFGYRTSRSVQLFGVKQAVQIEGGGRRGALGLPQPNVEAGVRLVVGGVWVTTRVIEALGPGLVGVLADDRLRKTADMSDIVEDARWVDLLHAVQPRATRLLRTERGSAYRPPRLPARVQERPRDAGDPEVALEPLPDRIAQIPPRTPVALTALQAMAPDEPLFWVEPDVADSLTAPCDPVPFPYRVLVLTPGQARTVEATLGEGGPRLSRLTNPEDVSFVRNAMDRRHGVHVIRLRTDIHLEGEPLPRALPLQLRLHLDGPRPRWDTEDGRGEVPAAMVRDGRTVITTRLPLALHDVSVVLDVSGQRAFPHGALRDALRQAVQREAWRLLPTDGPAADPWRRRLELALLADHARPQFVREHRPAQVRTRFPVAWKDVAQRLLRAPIARTTDGPLSLADFVALMGTDRVHTLADPGDRPQVEPLEARFGFGHLVLPEDLLAPLAAVGRSLDSWVPRTGVHLGDPTVEELILVFPALAEPTAPDGWRALPRVAPGIAHWIRDDDAADATDRPRPRAPSAGAPALLDHLRALDQAGWEARPSHLTAERAHALGRLAALRLAALCDRLGEVRLTDTRGQAHPVSTALSDPATRFVARGGASTDAEGILPVTLDELRVLQGVLDADPDRRERLLPLLLDDPPDLWEEPGAADRWLVTLPVDQAGLRGWLGLRLPFDATPGVLLEATDHLEVLPGFTARVPCHGLLQLTGAQRLSRAQRELLFFSGMQLYQQLLRRLDGDLHPTARAAGLAYAARFAQRTFQRDDGLRPGLARSLAQRVRVTDEHGKDWGSLADWLEALPDQRPPPPEGVEPDPEPVRTGEVVHLADADSVWGFLAGPLERALAAQRPGTRVQISEGLERGQLAVAHAEDASRCGLLLRRTPLANKALGGDRLARGLLLVEATRAVLQWAERVPAPLDVLAFQQAVLATRVTEG